VAVSRDYKELLMVSYITAFIHWRRQKRKMAIDEN